MMKQNDNHDLQRIPNRRCARTAYAISESKTEQFSPHWGMLRSHATRPSLRLSMTGEKKTGGLTFTAFIPYPYYSFLKLFTGFINDALIA